MIRNVNQFKFGGWDLIRRLPYEKWRGYCLLLLQYHLNEQCTLGGWPMAKWYALGWDIPTAVHEILRQMGREPEECLYDFERDNEGSKEAGERVSHVVYR